MTKTPLNVENFIADFTALVERHGNPPILIALRVDNEHSTSGIHNISRGGEITDLVYTAIQSARDILKEENIILSAALLQTFLGQMELLLGIRAKATETIIDDSTPNPKHPKNQN